MHDLYEKEEGPTPDFKIPRELSLLTKWFIVSAIVYFVIAGSLAIVMRSVQSGANVMGSQNQTFGLFYASLTVHGQLMFFGFMSMLVVGLSYFLLAKFAKKPLYSMNLALLSFSLLNAGAVLLIVSGLLFFGAGWYNLMPLTFHPGNNGWNIVAAVTFLLADSIIGVGLTVFCVNVIATVLKGPIAAGLQRTENSDNHKSASDESDPKRADMLESQDISRGKRWLMLIGISAWLPAGRRSRVPAASIVVVGIFVNSLIQLIGNVGLFGQIYIGFSSIMDPNFSANWLLAKDFWWFFAHPIVYFTLFSFLGAAYYYIPRYAKKTVDYDKWAYRPWPFYFVFTLLVFSHHLFMDMPTPPAMQMVSQVASFGIAFPSGLSIMTIMMYIFRSRIKWNVTSLFIVAGIAGWAFGGFAGVETGWWGTNMYLHNTLNIVGHIHLVLLMGSVLLALGLIYAIVPGIVGRNLNRNLAMLHLILTVVGGFGLALMFLFLGMGGFIRREAQVTPEFAWSLPWLMFFALVVGSGQMVFVYNLFTTLYSRGKSLAQTNDAEVVPSASSA